MNSVTQQWNWLPMPNINSISNKLSEAVSLCIDFFASVYKEAQEVKKSLHERVITKLEEFDTRLEVVMPNNIFQEKIDALVREIEKQFAPLNEFTKWLDSNGHGSWYQQLAIFLFKLPMRTVRNILNLLYNIIRGSICAAVHPLKALNQLAKLLANLVCELTKPEVWSKIGAGMVGASAGHSLATGNPLSVIGLGIGAAMILGGLGVDALQASLDAEKGKRAEAALQNIWSQVMQLPEITLTGFCMGLIAGGIQRATTETAMTVENKTSQPPHIPPYKDPWFPTKGHPDISGYREYFYPTPRD